MNKLAKGKTKKFIIVILICVMLATTFPMPVNANVGGALLKPISQLLCKIGDLILKSLQKVFIGYKDIGIENPGDAKTYSIYYSPAIIFSGQVAALDVNFVNPLGEKGKVAKNIKEVEYELVNQSITVKELEENYNFNQEDAAKNREYDGFWKTIFRFGTDSIYYIWTDENTGTEYFYLAYKNNEWKDMAWWEWFTTCLTLGLVRTFDDIKDHYDNSGTLYRIIETEETTVAKTSIAYQLRSIVSKAFTGMQIFAIVGLLSVLVYISIRIIIGSVGDKSKYKQMLMDWLTAMCILFALLYLMVFILSITQQITNVLTAKTISADGKDILMTNLRNTVEGTIDFSDVFGETMVYLALVFFTCLFTIKYLKRVVYMAFLTMIAPLIALTYPLDKIKDNKAQAFSMWLKEYIFNAMIQPVDYLLYCILLGSSLELLNNPIYALVAIGFLTPAEKFFRKMFGMNSSTPVGELGAAAAGATTMNLINKLAGGDKKKDKKKGEKSNSNIRTADRNSPISITNPNGRTSEEAYANEANSRGIIPEEAYANEANSRGIIPEEAYANEANSREIIPEEAYANEANSRRKIIEGENGAYSETTTTRGRNLPITRMNTTTSNRLEHSFAETSRMNEQSTQQGGIFIPPRHANNLDEIFRRQVKKPQSNIKSGIRAVASDLGKEGGKVLIEGVKSTGKTAFRMAGEGLGAIIATAATAADGNSEKLVQNIIVATSVGGNAAGKLGETVVNTPENIDRRIRTSEEMRRERQFTEGDYREFFKTREGKELLKQYAQEEIEQCLKEGIRGGKDIEKIVKVSRTLKTRNKNTREPIRKAIAYKHMAETCPKEILKDEKSFGNYLRQNNIPTQNIREIREGISLFQ